MDRKLRVSIKNSKSVLENEVQEVTEVQRIINECLNKGDGPYDISGNGLYQQLNNSSFSYSYGAYSFNMSGIASNFNMYQDSNAGTRQITMHTGICGWNMFQDSIEQQNRTLHLTPQNR